MLLNYERLLILVCISVFTLTTTGACVLVACLRPWLQRRVAQRRPRDRARLWMAVRFLPVLSGLLTAAGAALAFVRYEPRNAFEQTGLVLVVLAWAAAFFGLLATWRICRASWNTARCHRLIDRLGERMTTTELGLPTWRVAVDFPLVAVSGILRPRLILSSRILDECPPDELATVLRHEAAHTRHRDNFVRACFLACPDVLGFAPAGAKVLREWHQAVEEAADEEAAGSDDSARAALAAALVRVGRMSVGGRPAWMPALALYDGHPLENRVRRLLQPNAQQNAAPRSMIWNVAGALMIATGVWVATGPRLLHALMEWGVRNLP